jgi:hypothetical protein
MLVWSADALVRGRPSHLQFASDGAWEKALVCPGPGELTAWLEAAPSDVAFEIFMEASVGLARFAGIRLASLPSSECSRICTDAIADFSAMRKEEAPAILSWLRRLVRLEQLFRELPAYCEIGVVDAWRSSGPVRFWTAMSGISPSRAFRELREREPRLMASFVNPVAIELAFEKPLPHWLGFIVSVQDGAGHRLDQAAARLILERLASDGGWRRSKRSSG